MAKIEVQLEPWTTPNFVQQAMPPRSRQEGFKEKPAIPLADLDAETLSDLCDEFRASIFKKAGKADPRK